MRIANRNVWVDCDDDGSNLTVYDCRNDQTWKLDEESIVFSCDKEPAHSEYSFRQLKPVKAGKTDQSEITVTYKGVWHGVSCMLEIRYNLREDHVEITLPGDTSPKIQAVSIPGSFIDGSSVDYDNSPDTGCFNTKFLIPVMQGMYWDGRGSDFDWQLHEGSHGGFSLAMYGLLGESGGLLITAETGDDTQWRVGKENGKPFVSNIQKASVGKIGYDRKIRIYPTRSDITTVMKRYRERFIEKNRFITWEEKLKTRPDLERLFGTIICFTGYCRDDINYAEECKKLKDLGFLNAHLFPVRFNTFSKDFKMGGFPPVDESPQTVEKIKELGYDVAPWTWICESLEDGTEEMRLRTRIFNDGKSRLTWQIDDYKWYKTCNCSLPDYQKQSVETGVCRDLTWDHFDVFACACNMECYAPDHPAHPGRPMGRTEDREYIRRLFLTARGDGSRVISSEGFNDHYSAEYDIGSVLAWPQYEPFDFFPIPMTMLVFHDSMIHTWWEPHAYNDDHFGREMHKYQYGGGKPKLMSAMDALYGNPPLVFPFGAQYAWTGNGQETVLYKYRLEDPITQIALDRAKKVADLHKMIGKLEMIDFEFITPNFKVQKTTFECGTTVYANFDHCLHYIPDVGTLESESWIVIQP